MSLFLTLNPRLASERSNIGSIVILFLCSKVLLTRGLEFLEYGLDQSWPNTTLLARIVNLLIVVSTITEFRLVDPSQGEHISGSSTYNKLAYSTYLQFKKALNRVNLGQGLNYSSYYHAFSIIVIILLATMEYYVYFKFLKKQEQDPQYLDTNNYKLISLYFQILKVCLYLALLYNINTKATFLKFFLITFFYFLVTGYLLRNTLTLENLKKIRVSNLFTISTAGFLIGTFNPLFIYYTGLNSNLMMVEQIIEIASMYYLGNVKLNLNYFRNTYHKEQIAIVKKIYNSDSPISEKLEELLSKTIFFRFLIIFTIFLGIDYILVLNDYEVGTNLNLLHLDNLSYHFFTVFY